MSNEQKPIVGIGHEFPAGKVVAIKNDHIVLETAEGLKKFSFPQIERFIHDERVVLEA